MSWTYTLLYQCLIDPTKMKRSLMSFKVSIVNEKHHIVICSSKNFACMFKIAHEWAKKNPYLDFTIRFAFILTHISWGFYSKDIHSICAFVAMAWSNISLSLYIYLIIKIVASVIVCSLGSWVIMWWILFQCLHEPFESSEEKTEDNTFEREQEEIYRQNLNQLGRLR